MGWTGSRLKARSQVQLAVMKKKNTGRAFIVFVLIAAMVPSLHASALAGYFESGTAYYVHRNYAKAREMFLKAVEEKKSDGNAYYFLGEIEKNERNYDKAAEYYRAATRGRISQKYHKLAYWNIIVLLEQKGDYPEMIKVCKELYNRLGDHSARGKVETLINKLLWTENEEAQGEYKKGIKLKDDGSIAEAEGAFRRALQIDYAFMAPRFELGMIQFKKKNYGEALSLFGEVAAKIPFYGEVYLLMGDIQLQRGFYHEAAQCFERAGEYGFLDGATRRLVLEKTAAAYYNARDYARARESAQAALKGNLGSLDALLFLSALDIREEKFESALELLERARKIDPDNPEILFQMGSAHYRKKSPSYVGYFDRLFDRAASSGEEVPEKYIKAFALLAHHHFENANYERAGRIVSAIPENRRDAGTSALYARALYRQGEYEAALAQFERRFPSSDDDRYLLCILYARTGKHERAKSTLKGLAGRGSYMDRARRDPHLKAIANELDEERNRGGEK